MEELPTKADAGQPFLVQPRLRTKHHELSLGHVKRQFVV